MANRKIYLVDSENVSCEWLALCPKLGSRDNIVLFYTEKSPFISYPNLVRILPYLERLELVQCYMGPNALDFQMCTYLGAKLAKPTKTEYFIVSNDRGYQPVVKFWKDRGRLISQINHAGLMRLTAEKPGNPVAKEPVKPTGSPKKDTATLMDAVREVVQHEAAMTENLSVRAARPAVANQPAPAPKKIAAKTSPKPPAKAKSFPKKPTMQEKAHATAELSSVPPANAKKDMETVPEKREPAAKQFVTTPKPKRSATKPVGNKPELKSTPHANTKAETATIPPKEEETEQFVTAPKPKRRTTTKPVGKKPGLKSASHANTKEETEIVPAKEEPTTEQFVTAPKPKKRTTKKHPSKKPAVKPKTETDTAEKTVLTKAKGKIVKNKTAVPKMELNRIVKAAIGDSMPLKARSIGKISNVLLETPSQELTHVHAGLVKAFDAQKGRDIYRVLKPELPHIFQSIHHPVN